MRIYIKTANVKRFFIPVPLTVAGFACRTAGFVLKKLDKQFSEQEKEIFNCIDFYELARSLRYLRGYKGLKLVEVSSQAGDEITIIL